MDTFIKLVHIDLKGAPIQINYLIEIIPLLKQYGMNGLLMEYEDMFPYSGDISYLARSDSYSEKELQMFLKYCKDQDVIVIPLVQTFGHMEFVLKHEKLRYLRENFKFPMTICPTLNDSIILIKEMINQILCLHSDSKYIHLGADEVFDFNVCVSCSQKGLDKSLLYLEHVINIAKFVQKTKSIQPIIWDDMLRDINPSLIKSVQLSNFVEPMIWNYTPLLTVSDAYLTSMLSLFPRVWAASAYKGANGAVQQIVNTSVYVKNNQSWIMKIITLNDINVGKFVGIALTGWSRFDHFASLCEILPASIPCLILCLEIVTKGSFTVEMHERLSKELGFPELIPWEPMIKCVDPGCLLTFPGFEIFQGLSGWFLLSSEYNQLINSDFMNGWMSKYHRDHLVGNGASVGQLVKSMNSIHQRFTDWRKIFEISFKNVLVSSSVEEWFQCHIQHKLLKLNKRIRQGNQIIALGDSVFDRKQFAGDS